MPRRNFGRIVRVALLPIAWAITAALMVFSYFSDPFVPGLGQYRGHNLPGDLPSGLVASLIELAVVFVLVRPWTLRRLWPRALLVLALSIPWAIYSMFMVMHAGGIFAAHFFWVFCVVVLLLVYVAWGASTNRSDESRAP